MWTIIGLMWITAAGCFGAGWALGERSGARNQARTDAPPF